MSIPPHASRVFATRFSSCALSEMRAVTAIASPPVAQIAAATSSHGSWLRDEITTLAPAWAKASAIARPMPRDEPVTIATFPVRSNRFIETFPGSVTRAHAGVYGAVGLAACLDARVRGHDNLLYIPSRTKGLRKVPMPVI